MRARARDLGLGLTVHADELEAFGQRLAVAQMLHNNDKIVLSDHYINLEKQKNFHLIN